MIFSVLKDEFDRKAPKSDCIEIKVIVPREALEDAIRDVLETS